MRPRAPPNNVDSRGNQPPLKPPIGAGHLAAMGRLGLDEARAALQALPDSNIVREGPPGLLGKPTQGEVAIDRRSESLDFNEERRPSLNEYVKRAEARSRDLYGRAPEQTKSHDPSDRELEEE